MGVNIFIISVGFFRNMFESVKFEMNLVNIVMLIVIGVVLFFFGKGKFSLKLGEMDFLLWNVVGWYKKWWNFWEGFFYEVLVWCSFEWIMFEVKGKCYFLF